MPNPSIDRAMWREQVRVTDAVRVRAHLTVTGLDLIATSVIAFVGGWIIGYLVAAS